VLFYWQIDPRVEFNNSPGIVRLYEYVFTITYIKTYILPTCVSTRYDGLSEQHIITCVVGSHRWIIIYIIPTTSDNGQLYANHVLSPK
jgi:hypothetical protein